MVFIKRRESTLLKKENQKNIKDPLTSELLTI